MSALSIVTLKMRFEAAMKLKGPQKVGELRKIAHGIRQIANRYLRDSFESRIQEVAATLELGDKVHAAVNRLEATAARAKKAA